MERSDEALIIAHRQGDPVAFGELVERYSTTLLAYLTRMMGERQQAEDLFQDTFLRVHSKAWSFREGAKFKPWLFTIATRMAIDVIRKRQRRPESLALNGNGFNPGLNHEAVSDQTSDPSDAAAQSEAKEQVRWAVGCLPGRQKAALMLSYYHDLSYPEVAEIMKCSVGTIKTHMSRALKTLARILPDPRKITK